MNRELSIRQIVSMYLYVSISPVLRQLPAALAREAGRSGYLSPLWSVISTALLTGIILLLIKSYPGLNLYEIMVHLTGVFLAKVLIFTYLVWAILSVTAKVNIYALTLQFTLMPRTRSDFFMVIMILLVYYALLRGSKTVFRFSELTLGPILFLFGVLFICAVSRLRTDYLVPVSTMQLPSTILASKNVAAIGGNMVLGLFFADQFNITVTKKQKRKLWYGAAVFTVLALIITIFSFGITGADITADLPFPFYITVKSISFFNVFERFEVLVTLICVLSDFIMVCILAMILMRCFMWLFGITEKEFLFVPLAMLVFYLTYFLSSTQFEFDYFYRKVIINLNLVFQYLIPLILGLLCLLKRKNIKKQY